jgi:NADH-quinone oxidoreductase subunit G
VKDLPVFEGVLRVAPKGDARFGGQRLPRQTLRNTSRTSIRANISVSEPGIPNDPDSPFTFSMEGYRGLVPGSVLPSATAPGWNSVQGLTKFQDEVGGTLRGGDPGVRLIEPSGRSAEYCRDIPAAYQPLNGECLAVPMHHIFGSCELSVKTRAIAERMGASYLAMNPADADALGVKAGDTASLTIGAKAYPLPVQLRPALPRGVVGVPSGYPGLVDLQLPAQGKVAKRATS